MYFDNNFFMFLVKSRFFTFCIFVVCLLILPVFEPIFNNSYNQEITYFFYTFNLNYDIANASIINNGNYSIVACNINNAKQVKKQIKSRILSESIRIENYSDDTYHKVFDKYKKCIVKMEQCEEYDFLLCYDSTLNNYVITENKKVNIQVAITKNQINIGYPLIFNGY